jgi:hypothetical protein
MSESTAPSPKTNQGGRAAHPPERKRHNETGEFELRRAQLALLLIGLDREFWKRGMTEETDHDSATSAGGCTDDEERKRVNEVTGIMFRELESRLVAFTDACARLGEDERASLATLLRLPEVKRRAIVAMLRLPERERSVLRIAFGLAGAECEALGDLLRPMISPAAERPSITIVDPSVVEENDPPAS